MTWTPVGEPHPHRASDADLRRLNPDIAVLRALVRNEPYEGPMRCNPCLPDETYADALARLEAADEEATA